MTARERHRGMSIWGKIIGGAAGFALGGPLGALLGGLAGHAFDRFRGDGGGDTGTKQIAFTIGVIVLGAKMAKADGLVTKDEIQAFRQVFQVPPEEVKNVARVFDLAKKDSGGFEPYARQLAGLFRDNPTVLEDLLGGLFHIAKADNVYHPTEDRFLRDVARIFGFSETEFERIRANHVGPEEADPYVQLGLTRDATDEEIKRRYRQLIRENHPDTLIAQGMPQEFIDLANEKLATINGAYERITRERQLG
jgi:DnaJ like chaperone protein